MVWLCNGWSVGLAIKWSQLTLSRNNPYKKFQDIRAFVTIPLNQCNVSAKSDRKSGKKCRKNMALRWPRTTDQHLYGLTRDRCHSYLPPYSNNQMFKSPFQNTVRQCLKLSACTYDCVCHV